jgi:hypothetical protein
MTSFSSLLHGLFALLGDDVCSQEAVVTSQSSKPEKQTAIIIAEEKGSGVGEIEITQPCLTMTIFNEFGNQAQTFQFTLVCL